MKARIQQIIICAGICSFFLLNACAPVHRLTKIKSTPREYVRNYCCGEIAVPRSVDKRGPWVVYSDRNNNTTYYNPGGKVPLKKASYLEPFVVIGRKGEFLRLVKYSPEVIEGGRIKNWRKAEYYGWMHQDNLLLSSHATTDIATGHSLKMVTMVKDGESFSRLSDFMEGDSVIIYKEPELLTPAGKVPFQMPIYQAKRNHDRTRTMVIATELINPDSTATLVSGWLPSSLLMPFGSLLYMDYSCIPVQSANLYNQTMEEVPLSKALFDQIVAFAGADRLSSLNPVAHIDMGDSISEIRTTLPVPVIDSRNNFIYSVSGKKIRQVDFKGIKEKLSNMNIVFVFSGQQPVYNRFEQLVSSLQGVKEVMAARSAGYSFRLGAVMGFDKSKGSHQQVVLSANLDEAFSELEQYADNKKKVVPHYSDDAWDALRAAIRMLKDHHDESNLIILVGENGNAQEHMDPALINDLADSNCRVLAYQLFSDEGNKFNNFVLQAEHLVKHSAQRISKKKQDILVHSEQVHSTNQYVELSENIYRLDYPKASMTQGWIIFPKKKEELSPDLLVSSTDSLIREIQEDNESIIAHLRRAFVESGTGRTKLDALWMSMEKLPANYTVSSKTYKELSLLAPQTNFPLTLQVPTVALGKGSYYFLLNESELAKLRGFMQDLTRLRVDYKYSAKQHSTKKEKRRTCPDEPEYYAQADTTVEAHDYLNTNKVRKSLVKAYYKWVRFGKVYPMKKGDIKRMSLSMAQQEAVAMPSLSEMMRGIKVGDLSKKKIVTDAELDHLIDYFLKKRKALEEAITPENRIEVNGQTFYKINAEVLP